MIRNAAICVTRPVGVRGFVANAKQRPSRNDRKFAQKPNIALR